MHAYVLMTNMDNKLLHSIQKALNQELVLGREDFNDRIEKLTARQIRPDQSGRSRVDRAGESMGDYHVF